MYCVLVYLYILYLVLVKVQVTCVSLCVNGQYVHLPDLVSVTITMVFLSVIVPVSNRSSCLNLVSL